MKLLTKYLYIVIIVILFQLISCKTVRSVDFESPVDTSNKKITLQQKKVYNIPKKNIFISNLFDGARLNGVEIMNDSTASLIIEPENTPINPSPYYAFSAWSDTTKAFYFTFKYPKGYKHRYAPKIKENENWAILDSSRIFVLDTIVTIKLQLSKKPITVAAQEIQSFKDVENWYSSLIKNKQDIVNVRSAGKSKLGRNLPILDIYKNSTKNKPIIVLLTRQHPPEVTGYYAFQHFLETILNRSELSEQFLSKYRILAFPIMNPDGVDLGHWRHNAGGIDLNRDWSNYNQPEVKLVVKFIEKIVKKDDTKLLLGLDFHSTWYDVFYTNNERKNTALPNFIDNWFKSLEQNINNYKVNEQSANSKKPVSKGWFLKAHNAVGITYEIGDSTTKKDIQTIGKTSAEQMMQLLLNN